MNVPIEIGIRRSDHAIHFEADGFQFLELRRGGDCVIRITAPDGSLHVHIQSHPGLLPAMVSVPGVNFAIAIQDIPSAIAEHFLIPSVIVFFPPSTSDTRILMAREPLGDAQLHLLRDHLGSIFGVLNRDKLYRHKSDMG